MINQDISKMKFLPLGTVVNLKKGTKRVMITGFCVTDESRKKLYDYTGCLYPEGVITSKQSMVFNHDQINEIFALGYSDEEEKAFKKKLENLLNDKMLGNIGKKDEDIETL